MSTYGNEFDSLAEKIHPDRDQCGGVGGCSMMRAAHMLESRMIDVLTDWRGRNR